MFKMAWDSTKTNYEGRLREESILERIWAEDYNELVIEHKTHVASNNAHGTTSDVVGIADIQSFTNKTIDDYTNKIHADATHIRVKATEVILKGQPVVVTGYNVGESALDVELANNLNGVANGLAETDMVAGEFGNVLTTGVLEDFDTSSWVEGVILYVNGAGILTDVEPTIGFAQPLAYVLRSNLNNGSVQVNANYPKQDASDVRYDATNSVEQELDSKAELIHNHIVTEVTDFQTGVSNNTNVFNNTTHRSSSGEDHSFINQNVTSTGSPNFQLVNLSRATDPASPIEGDMWYNTTSHQLKMYNGTSTIILG